ncbi:hypothetical protein V6N12_000241, partial [Hibiscus sabdariffa]
ELLWRQKAWSDWVTVWDCNTAYFHQKARRRKVRNHISSFQLNDGVWFNDETMLRTEATNFLWGLYYDSRTINGHFPYTGCFPMVSQPLLDSLASVSTMSKGSVDQDQIVKGILNEFGVYSGYRTLLIGNYLGVPVFHQHMQVADFDFILSRPRAKLNGWVASSLLMVGRVTLAKLVLAAIHAFFMQTSKFLTSVCAKIDKIVRGFIWGSSALAHKISLVNWSAISQPRGRGGLGISCSNERNTTFMQKLAFSLVSSPDAILIMALRQKYRMINTCNGNDVHLWNDTWVPTLGLLRPWASSASTNIEHLRFEDLLLGDGQWNVGSLMDHVHQLVVPHIMGVLPPSLGATLYTVAWKLTLTGSFSVTSAYECMVESAWDALDFKWSRIWIGFAWASYFANAILVQSPPLQPMIDSFQWQVPPHDRLCLNTDAAVSLPERLGTIRGIFRDSSGEWIKGYYKSIGIVSSLQAERWRILVGLQLAWSIGVSCLQVQSDSFVIVRLVLDPMAKTSSAPLFHAIALFFSRNWSIDFTWVPREQNMVVDSLSKLSPHPYYHLMLFDAVPEIIQPRP